LIETLNSYKKGAVMGRYEYNKRKDYHTVLWDSKQDGKREDYKDFKSITSPYPSWMNSYTGKNTLTFGQVYRDVTVKQMGQLTNGETVSNIKGSTYVSYEPKNPEDRSPGRLYEGDTVVVPNGVAATITLDDDEVRKVVTLTPINKNTDIDKLEPKKSAIFINDSILTAEQLNIIVSSGASRDFEYTAYIRFTIIGFRNFDLGW
jgi:hypothetical protein